MIPVCLAHKKEFLNDMKCICGEELDIRTGKYGVFFTCIRCGNMNLRKVLEINPKPVPKTNNTSNNKENKQKKEPTIITTTSDDPRFFDQKHL